MKERPILFSAPMVRAILGGKKTQTRRLLKQQPFIGEVEDRPDLGRGWLAFNGKTRLNNPTGEAGLVDLLNNFHGSYRYAEAGDRLWVKETWRTAAQLDEHSPTRIAEKCLDAGYSKPWCPVRYEADGRRENEDRHQWVAEGKTRVSIHMPRWLSRITLEVVSVRVERLQDISLDDARAEGAQRFDEIPTGHPYSDSAPRWSMESPTHTNQCLGSARMAFANLINKINGPETWDSKGFV